MPLVEDNSISRRLMDSSPFGLLGPAGIAMILGSAIERSDIGLASPPNFVKLGDTLPVELELTDCNEAQTEEGNG